MYIPKHYKNENIDEIKDFLGQNSFGILINQDKGRPCATHIPLELDKDNEGKDILVGHISKANPQWRNFESKDEVLAIFNGPHSYISSSWYKEEEVPTWNYIAIHIYGSIRVINKNELMASLHKLVDKHERNSKKPISLDKLSPKTMRQVDGIVGFHITINDIQATYKLSQTRQEDHTTILNELDQNNSAQSSGVAEAMRKHNK